jgi:hypothetical protein
MDRVSSYAGPQRGKRRAPESSQRRHRAVALDRRRRLSPRQGRPPAGAHRQPDRRSRLRPRSTAARSGAVAANRSSPAAPPNTAPGWAAAVGLRARFHPAGTYVGHSASAGSACPNCTTRSGTPPAPSSASASRAVRGPPAHPLAERWPCKSVTMWSMRVRIDDLLANAPVDPQCHLDPNRVAHYARTPDAIPPVVVFETPQGRLLVDGYHRIAAAQQRGATEIDAELRRGSRREALQYAAARATMQRGITSDQALDRIRRRSVERCGRR